MAFRDIVGHERALDFLRRAIASGRSGASLIFHGPEGVGRRATALALAQALNCVEEPGEGCGRCSVCRRIARVDRGRIEEGPHKGDAREYTHHADVHLAVPGKEEIRIDEIRSIRENAQRKPFEGRRSVFIIDPAERMTPEAANALLKTLEEPPPTSCLILLATDPDALLPTVRSRCRLVPFHPLPLSKVAAHLETAASIAPEDAAVIAALTGGRLGRALRFDLEAYRSRRAAILEALARLAEPRPRAHVIKDAEIFGSRGEDEDVESALETLEALLRDAMVLHAGGSAERLIDREMEDPLRRVAAALGEHLPGRIRRIAEARRDVRSNVNRQLLLEVLLLDLAADPASSPA
jgi:DNA polymerase III subunit delta'